LPVALCRIVTPGIILNDRQKLTAIAFSDTCCAGNFIVQQFRCLPGFVCLFPVVFVQ
jgi:hypothetical protein